MSISQLPSGRWRLQIRRKTLEHDKLYDSEEEAKRVEKELLSRKETDKKLTLTKLNEQYQASNDFAEKSIETQRTERSRIKPVLKKFGDYTLQELQENTELIYDYMDDRLRQKSQRTGKKVGAPSVRLEVAALSALVGFAKKRRKVRENFVSRIERPTSKPRKRRIDNTEQGALTLAARSGDPAVAQAARFQMLLRHLGCRPGELRGLRVENIRLKKSELSFLDTKNGTDRTVHTTSEARTMIELQLQSVDADSEYLFRTWSNYKKDWVLYNYTEGVKQLKKAKVVSESFHSHAGRREFISRAIEASIPLTTIKKQTGHKSTQALEIYDNGLSTAPEIRAELDRLADNVKTENLLGAFEALGLTDEQRGKVLKTLGKSEWTQPFKH
jgi:integrase